MPYKVTMPKKYHMGGLITHHDNLLNFLNKTQGIPDVTIGIDQKSHTLTVKTGITSHNVGTLINQFLIEQGVQGVQVEHFKEEPNPEPEPEKKKIGTPKSLNEAKELIIELRAEYSSLESRFHKLEQELDNSTDVKHLRELRSELSNLRKKYKELEAEYDPETIAKLTSELRETKRKYDNLLEQHKQWKQSYITDGAHITSFDKSTLGEKLILGLKESEVKRVQDLLYKTSEELRRNDIDSGEFTDLIKWLELGLEADPEYMRLKKYSEKAKDTEKKLQKGLLDPEFVDRLKLQQAKEDFKEFKDNHKKKESLVQKIQKMNSEERVVCFCDQVGADKDYTLSLVLPVADNPMKSGLEQIIVETADETLRQLRYDISTREGLVAYEKKIKAEDAEQELKALCLALANTKTPLGIGYSMVSLNPTYKQDEVGKDQPNTVVHIKPNDCTEVKPVGPKKDLEEKTEDQAKPIESASEDTESTKSDTSAPDSSDSSIEVYTREETKELLKDFNYTGRSLPPLARHGRIKSDGKGNYTRNSVDSFIAGLKEGPLPNPSPADNSKPDSESDLVNKLKDSEDSQPDNNTDSFDEHNYTARQTCKILQPYYEKPLKPKSLGSLVKSKKIESTGTDSFSRATVDAYARELEELHQSSYSSNEVLAMMQLFSADFLRWTYIRTLAKSGCIISTGKGRYEKQSVDECVAEAKKQRPESQLRKERSGAKPWTADQVLEALQRINPKYKDKRCLSGFVSSGRIEKLEEGYGPISIYRTLKSLIKNKKH